MPKLQTEMNPAKIEGAANFKTKDDDLTVIGPDKMIRVSGEPEPPGRKTFGISSDDDNGQSGTKGKTI